MKYVVNKIEEDNRLSMNPRIPQYMAAAAVTVGGFGMGNVLGWSSPALPNLARSEDFLDITSSDQSWIGSLVTVGALLGALVAGISIDRLGRKFTMMISSIFFLTGWLCIVLAHDIYLLCAGRLLTGIGVGTLSLVAPVYLTEISDSQVRGMIGVAFQLMVVLGMLFSSVLGYLTSWRWLSIASTIVPVIFAVGISFIPESPRYLLHRGYLEKATDSLIWLKSSNPLKPSSELTEELENIQESVTSCKDKSVSLKALCSASLFQPILITLCLIMFNQVCGISAVNFYTVHIFDLAGTGLNSYLSTIVVGIVQVVAVLLASAVVDKAGRRVLLISSFILMHLSLVSLGIFFYMKKSGDFHPEQSLLRWLPLSSVIVFNVGYCIGIGSLVWTVMSEILPSNVIGPVFALGTAFNWVLAFLITRFFDVLNKALEIQNTFWLFSGCCVAAAFFIIFTVPETKAKSLQQIQEECFNKGRNSKSESKADLVSV